MLGDTILSEVITVTVTHQLLTVDSSRKVWAPAPDGRERMGNQNFCLQTFEYETSAVGIEDQSFTIYRKQFMYALNRTRCLLFGATFPGVQHILTQYLVFPQVHSRFAGDGGGVMVDPNYPMALFGESRLGVGCAGKRVKFVNNKCL